MSIQERVAEIQSQRVEEDSRRQKEEGAREEAKAKRFSEMLPQVHIEQAHLLEKLRKVGMIGLVEELVGPIFPFRDDNGKYIVREPTENEWDKQAKFAQEKGIDKAYEAEFLPQRMNGDGLPERALRIKLTHNYRLGIHSRKEFIILDCDPDGGLIISGEREEFSDNVLEDTRLDEIKEAIAQALACPKQEQDLWFRPSIMPPIIIGA